MTKKILIIGPAWVGDTVMAQSLFKLLKQNNPSSTLDVLAPAWTFSLLSRMPEVTEALELPFSHGEFNLKMRYQLGKKMAARKYDQAIVLPNSFKSALIPWFAKIPKRTGWLGECRYVVLNDIRFKKQRYPLMVQQYLALGLGPKETLPVPLPFPSLQVSQTSQQQTLEKHKPLWRGKPILALSAGGEFGPSKRWPEKYFAEVANQKIAQGWDVWLFGSSKDKPITDKIMRLTDNRCENIAGRTVLAETIDLLSLVNGVITNDSGIMHIASALGKPVVAIYGSTSPAFTPPLEQKAEIVKLNLACQPCFKRTCPLKHHRCMQDLHPQRVLSAIENWTI